MSVEMQTVFSLEYSKAKAEYQKTHKKSVCGEVK